ncbi:helix-turn-helix domain-containing protein [Pseudomonas sp. NA-150]|uniref:helix-turn-helix domain-containing protein n=1 Tax=Pseudomonas sp. NA-150 TaxID=3367525 RepID=UPI0037CC1771
MNTIGCRLRQERIRLNFSQRELGLRCGVEANAQMNYENDRRSPNALYLVRAAEVGVDVVYVVTGKPTLIRKCDLHDSEYALLHHLQLIPLDTHQAMTSLIVRLAQMHLAAD